MVIPDTQCKPGESVEHLKWAGQYAVDMKPDVIIHIGDHWDFEALSSYDKGKGSAEGKRVVKDIDAGNIGLEAFMLPILNERMRLRRNRDKQWNPRLIFTMGNHENRLVRAVNDDPMLEGLLTEDMLSLRTFGWEVVPFLQPIVVDGIAYCHYFTSGVMGRPVSSARLMLTKKMMSCTMGHVQDREISYARRADGQSVTGLFAGIFYQHDEGYLNPQTNLSWRGVWIKNEVNDGHYDEMPVSLRYLRKRYGKA
tara:strand:- start:25 stop:783 length:759 start_codon:yes stop_codon:yes gene_type:complete